MPIAPLAAPLPRSGTRRLVLHGPDDPQRGEVESFIRTVFAQRFGASLTRFAPRLVSLHDDSGIVAAAGYRPGAEGALFLERYLDTPVEDALASFDGSAPERASIVEVGHLASARAGEGKRLILQLGPHLAAQGFQWVVSTLTEELRQLFVRLGVVPYALGRADAAALGEAARDWGSYYEHRPVVLAGQLPLALRQLRQRGLVDHGGTA
jgi:Thermostable hemolysin